MERCDNLVLYHISLMLHPKDLYNFVQASTHTKHLINSSRYWQNSYNSIFTTRCNKQPIIGWKNLFNRSTFLEQFIETTIQKLCEGYVSISGEIDTCLGCFYRDKVPFPTVVKVTSDMCSQHSTLLPDDCIQTVRKFAKKIQSRYYYVVVNFYRQNLLLAFSLYLHTDQTRYHYAIYLDV